MYEIKKKHSYVLHKYYISEHIKLCCKEAGRDHDDLHIPCNDK